MAGSREGGLKAARKILENDPDFYKKIGAKGGRNGNTGGFAANPGLARIAGAKGGRRSRRGPSKKIEEPAKQVEAKTQGFWARIYGGLYGQRQQ